MNEVERGFQPYLEAPGVADAGDSAPAAVATAAHGVLVGLFPAQQASLDTKLAASLALIPDGEAKTGGIEVGEAASATMLAARTDDGRFSPITVVEGFDPGEWRRTPLSDQGFLTRAFSMTEGGMNPHDLWVRKARGLVGPHLLFSVTSTHLGQPSTQTGNNSHHPSEYTTNPVL